MVFTFLLTLLLLIESNTENTSYDLGLTLIFGQLFQGLLVNCLSNFKMDHNVLKYKPLITKPSGVTKTLIMSVFSNSIIIHSRNYNWVKRTVSLLAMYCYIQCHYKLFLLYMYSVDIDEV